MKSNCTVSFGRNDLQGSRLKTQRCPIKNCDSGLKEIAHQRPEDRIRFCPLHGIRLYPDTFSYFNGLTKAEKSIALRRNIWFSQDYYLNRVIKSGAVVNPWSACNETSEDALTWNVFAEIARNKHALSDLITLITHRHYTEPVDLYLWGRKINLANNTYIPYQSLFRVRKTLEGDIRESPTEPDIMLVIPRKLVVCIEAKFGGANPVVTNAKTILGQRPKKIAELVKRYYLKNIYLSDAEPIFDVTSPPEPFYEELFRDIALAASMAKIESGAEWFTANLRSAHVMNILRGRPESAPVTKKVRSFLMPKYRKQFVHITWEDIFSRVIKNNHALSNLAWYLKNRSFNCVRAFNIV